MRVIWKTDLKFIGALFAAWFGLILLVSSIAQLAIEPALKNGCGLISSFSNWDGKHFLGIAQNGYRYPFQYAFFPLFPLLLRVLSFIPIPLEYIGVGLNLCFTFLGLVVFYRLLKFDLPKSEIRIALLSLLIFPTSFYFLMTYSESLFFLLSVGAFYMIRASEHKRRFAYILGAVGLAILASLTRLVGVAVVIGVLFQLRVALKHKPWLILLGFSGVILYGVALFWKTGNPLFFLWAEQNWQRTISYPGAGIFNSFTYFFSGGINLDRIIALVDVLSLMISLGLALRFRKQLPNAYLVYFVISLIIPLLSSELTSMPRFLLVMFPLFIIFAKIKSRLTQILLASFSLLLFTVGIALFTRGYWVS